MGPDGFLIQRVEETRGPVDTNLGLRSEFQRDHKSKPIKVEVLAEAVIVD